jgi:xanthine dehydrogenase small subunit
MHDTVRFILADQVEEIRNCDPCKTVLEFLREDRDLKGTKEGCAEGDCGACTVVIGELHDDDIRYRAVNSCIQFLATLDGKQLVTVEDLTKTGTQGKTELHAVQQAMLEQDGSQCGFCTPGFVMSLFAMFQNNRDTTTGRADIELGLAGNLCRCTGYAPIVRAAEQALTAERSDHFNGRKQHIVDLLKSIQSTSTLHASSESGHFYTPRTLAGLCKLLEANPQAVLVAGATDVGLWVTKQHRRLETVIYLGAVEELKQIQDDGEYLSIGSTVTYTDAADDITTRYPAFLPLIQRIGGTQVRNAGTIGGNIANGSPIGDMPPGLVALGAKLVLQSTRGQRVCDLEDYFISYGKQDLHAGECLAQVRLPVPPENQLFATYKVSKRFEQDISAVCGAFAVQINDSTINNARVCFGGMAETPKRAKACEKALEGKPWNQETINQAMQAMLKDFTPLTDMRASASYRTRVAQNLLQRFFLEQTAVPYPVRLDLPHTALNQVSNRDKGGAGE